MKQEEMNLADIAASFQAAVVDVLVAHTILAAKNYGLHQVAIAGGVASNSYLRSQMLTVKRMVLNYIILLQFIVQIMQQ